MPTAGERLDHLMHLGDQAAWTTAALVMGHGRFSGDPIDDAVSRFKTVAYGGTALDDDQAAALLRDAGLDDVRNVPTPPGAPALTAGRRPRR